MYTVTGAPMSVSGGYFCISRWWASRNVRWKIEGTFTLSSTQHAPSREESSFGSSTPSSLTVMTFLIAASDCSDMLVAPIRRGGDQQFLADLQAHRVVDL